MNRLQTILSRIEKCETLADIGTDHAYLPIEAVRAGLCERAIACDIVAGPLHIAKKNIRAAQLEHKIDVRLGDGLRPLRENEADCIVIAGMGGMNIIEIFCGGFAPGAVLPSASLLSEPPRTFLENAETSQNEVSDKSFEGGSGETFSKVSPEKIPEKNPKKIKFILQPQHDLEELRRFLIANGYKINETLARERSRFYVVVDAQKSCENSDRWTDRDFFLGKIDDKNYFRALREKIEKYFDSLTEKNSRDAAQKKLEWLEEKIHDR